MESSKEGFNRIRNALLKAFDFENHLIPSYYYVTRHRPKVNSAIFQVADCLSFLTRESQLKKKATTTGKKHMNDILEKDKRGGKNYIARLYGSIEDNILHLLEKIERVLGDNFMSNHSPKVLLMSSANSAWRASLGSDPGSQIANKSCQGAPLGA